MAGALRELIFKPLNQQEPFASLSSIEPEGALRELVFKPSNQLEPFVFKVRAFVSRQAASIFKLKPDVRECGENLVGLKIKVWWPHHQMFFEGRIESFDPARKKHRVVYTDGDEEKLFLRKEKWEIIEGESVPNETPHVREFGENLVGLKIKVWWPRHQMFCEGRIESFDPAGKKHRVIYTDGGEEKLFLRKEKWEIIEGESVPNEEQAADQSPDASPEMQQKAKTNSDVPTKPSRIDASSKKVGGTSSGKPKVAFAKTSRKLKDDDKNDGKLQDNASKKTKKSEIDASSKKAGGTSSGKPKVASTKIGRKLKDDGKNDGKLQDNASKKTEKSENVNGGMDWSHFEDLLAKKKGKKASKKKASLGGSSQMKDTLGTTDEALATPPPPTTLEGSGLHDPMVSGMVLRRAVLPKDSYELKMMLPEALTSAARHAAYQLSAMNLTLEDKVGEIYRVSMELRQQALALQEQLNASATREKALEEVITRIRKVEIPTAVNAAIECAISDYHNSDKFLQDKGKFVLQSYQGGFQRCWEQFKIKYPNIDTTGICSAGYGNVSPPSGEEDKEDDDEDGESMN
ncbi:sister chromatid cohesion protein PDS5 homolog C-like isoform X2 [Malania oleifera]|uniref:sister chromatid cohesion protein PDS5 homolog C-like isoform X2 n=1 Tax=Malania oleifera TaxID=397392 RepID=UPI0025AE2E64|nr:sister chromatid cohesion protein PDS5 homolog C-like isoform X2 [Malania oleifera]